MIFSNCSMRPRRSRNPNCQNASVCIVVSAMQKQCYAVITAVTCYDCFRKNLYFSLCRCILSALILLLHVIPLLLQPFFRASCPIPLCFIYPFPLLPVFPDNPHIPSFRLSCPLFSPSPPFPFSSIFLLPWKLWHEVSMAMLSVLHYSNLAKLLPLAINYDRLFRKGEGRQCFDAVSWAAGRASGL